MTVLTLESTSNQFLSSDEKFISKWRADKRMTVEGPVTNFKPFESFKEGNFPDGNSYLSIFEI